MSQILDKYAELLLKYCLEIKEGERLYIQSTMLAEPLVAKIYEQAIELGAWVEFDLKFAGQNKSFYNAAEGKILDQISPFYKKAVEEFEAYLYIRAPYNLFEDSNLDPEKVKRRKKATADISKTYFSRTATRDLKRNLCQFPTNAAAQNAGMSLEEYEKFVYEACHLYSDDPKGEWLKVRKHQQQIVDVLNAKSKIKYFGEGIDISFSTEGRTWINSDGQTNCRRD